MTENEKDLLLKDLCARLPYGVKVNVIYSNENASSFRQRVCVEGDNELNTDIIGLYQRNEIDIKPYLFPLSNMTEEIMDEIYATTGVYDISIDSSVHIEVGTTFEDLTKISDILHKHHIDYHGLIPMGLAIDATGLGIYENR